MIGSSREARRCEALAREKAAAEAQAAAAAARRAAPGGPASFRRRVLGAVQDWDRKGLPIDPRSWRFDQIRDSDLYTILEFHREYLRARPKLISITGDKSKIDMEALGRHGEIVEMELDDLFAF